MAKIVIGEYPVVISSEGVKVGCTFVSRKTVERVLAAIKKKKPSKFRIGMKVKVVQIVNDSEPVFGKTGRVVEILGKDITVRFLRWTGGHCGSFDDGSENCWSVDATALKVVK